MERRRGLVPYGRVVVSEESPGEAIHEDATQLHGRTQKFGNDR